MYEEALWKSRGERETERRGKEKGRRKEGRKRGRDGRRKEEVGFFKLTTYRGNSQGAPACDLQCIFHPHRDRWHR